MMPNRIIRTQNHNLTCELKQKLNMIVMFVFSNQIYSHVTDVYNHNKDLKDQKTIQTKPLYQVILY